MFQNFSDTSARAKVSARLDALRSAMAEHSIDVWLVPHGDEFRNEYLPACNERLAYISAFSGSAGFGVVMKDRAILFVDGRYTLQAANQTDPECFEIKSLVKHPPYDWLADVLETGMRVGFDPYTLSISEIKHFETRATGAGAELSSHDNLLDSIWHLRPVAPNHPVTVHPLALAGRAAADKITAAREAIAEKDADWCLITDPASVCWLFNIRGSDVAHTPLVLARTLIGTGSKPLLFINKQKISAEARDYLSDLCELADPREIETRLAALAANSSVLVDPNHTATAFARTIEAAGGIVIAGRDPSVLARAIKNDAEIKGAHAAHLRDGVAVTRFLCWLDRQVPGAVDEISAAKQLETLRRATGLDMENELLDLSFDTISGAGANGAIVHYRVTEASNATLTDGSLYLVDSGGQYSDGTTDITRTIALGAPPNDAINDFTYVLKGHIAIAQARFPQGTRGVDLDVLARYALWRQGKDYGHGTGHGVGAYLSVHEGPQSISRRAMEPLISGMIISNEPGYYREGQYGIRIENLVLVRGPTEIDGGNTPMLGFETLSLAPIDQRLIAPNIMTDQELHWLNAYHGWVNRTLSPYLNEDEQAWLSRACWPLSRELPAASA